MPRFNNAGLIQAETHQNSAMNTHEVYGKDKHNLGEEDVDANADQPMILDEHVIPTQSGFSKWIALIEDKIHEFFNLHWKKIRVGIYFTLFVAYIVYFGYSMKHRFGDEGSIVLLAITIFMLWKLFFKVLESRNIVIGLPRCLHSFLEQDSGRRVRKIVRYAIMIATAVAMITFLAVNVLAHLATHRRSFLGMLAIIFLCFIFSAKPSRVNWHPVFWSFAVQFALAYFTLRTQIGQDVFQWLGDLVTTLFSFANMGSALVIGKEFKQWGLALSTSGIFIFTNALIYLLNNWGVIEFIVLKLGGFLAFCLDTGPVESIVAAANTFLSLAEAPLLVRPYFPIVTRSEIHTIMTCGFASIAGGIMGIFIELGAPANHLLTAAVISAPAALGFSKLMYPETEKVARKSQAHVRMVDSQKSNSLTAFSDGAVMGVSLCVAAWSNLLAFIAMISMLNALVKWFGERAGLANLTFTVVFSYVIFPVAYMMGVDVSECRKVGELIGIKLLATPIVGYQELGFLIKNRDVLEKYQSSFNNTLWHWQGDDIILEAANTTLKGGVLSERTEVIATYALCGFSAFSAIGISLGILLNICPSRKKDIVDLVLRAFVAGNVASFATGAIAGVVFMAALYCINTSATTFRHNRRPVWHSPCTTEMLTTNGEHAYGNFREPDSDDVDRLEQQMLIELNHGFHISRRLGHFIKRNRFLGNSHLLGECRTLPSLPGMPQLEITRGLNDQDSYAVLSYDFRRLATLAVFMNETIRDSHLYRSRLNSVLVQIQKSMCLMEIVALSRGQTIIRDITESVMPAGLKDLRDSGQRDRRNCLILRDVTEVFDDIQEWYSQWI